MSNNFQITLHKIKYRSKYDGRYMPWSPQSVSYECGEETSMNIYVLDFLEVMLNICLKHAKKQTKKYKLKY